MDQEKKFFFTNNHLSNLTLSLFLCSLSCIILIFFRINITGSYRYNFFIWNIFLAWVPYLFSLSVVYLYNKKEKKLRFLIILITVLWLIFYPNTSYIISDFIYLAKYPIKIFNDNSLATPANIMWFDILLVFSSAFLGHILGLISLFVFHKFFELIFNKIFGWLIIFISIILSGFGIYLGRFIRLNSWDLVLTPYETTIEITNNIFNMRAVLFSIAFSVFTFVTYLVLYNFYYIKVEKQ
jgi:uncharacterized membrane protein